MHVCVQGQLILLSDIITDGSFLIHHFISQALKGKSKVSWSHHALYMM